MATKQNVIDAYNSLLTELSENEFYDDYIEWKTKTSLRNMFKNIEDWISRPLSDWQNNIFGVENSEDTVAQRCLLSVEIIRDFVSDFEILLSGGGGGTGDITGSGTSGRIALWNGNKTITSDGEFTYDSANDILTVENIKHVGNFKENVIVLNSNTTLDNTHSHIVLGEGSNGFIEVSGVTNHAYLNGLYEEVDLSIVNPYNLKKMYRKVGVTEPDNPEPAMWLSNNPAYSIYGWAIGNIDVQADFSEYPLGDGDNLTEEPHNVASFTGVNGGTGDIIVSLSSDPYAVSLPLITSSNVNITYNFKNITQNIINLNSFSPQKFDNGNTSTYSIGVGNQLKVVATEISTGVFTWITFN